MIDEEHDATPDDGDASRDDVADATSGGVDDATLATFRFPVDVPGFRGALDQLVIRAQRGEVDLTGIPVAAITRAYREGLGDDPGQLTDIADFLTLLARLVNLKAQAVLPDARANEEGADDDAPVDDAGKRLAEYRLFKAAADALLAEAAEEGARSFLGMVAPDVSPVERLRITPERLAAAFRGVLERLVEIEPLPVGSVTFSVEEMAERLRDRLRAERSIRFEDIFAGVGSRLEAVALFLGLLELLRNAEAEVDQRESMGPITVSICD